MRRFILIILILAISVSNINAGNIVRFRISKPLCLLTFMEAANKNWDASRTLTTYIYDRIAPEDESAFNSLVKKFAAISMNGTSVDSKYPLGRQKAKSEYDRIKRAAAQSSNIEEFLQKVKNILPYEPWIKLQDVMYAAEPYYKDIISEKSQDAAKMQLKELEQFSDKADVMFNKLKRFYGSTWSEDVPFTISIYPIPGKKGHTTATPHGKSLVMAVLTGETDYAMRMGVAMHEMSHVLYDEQSLKLQWELDNVFTSAGSGYARYAYSYLDEALATACGNGWAYEYMTGHVDQTTWYNDPYINGYAHAIYPMVREYINKGKRIDKSFILSAIAAFKLKFPDAVNDYSNLLNRVSLYTDAQGKEEFNDINATLRKYYRITSCSSSFPIADEQTVSLMKKTAGTQLFIVHENHKENFAILKDIYPQLRTVKLNREAVISFFDKKKRPVIIVNVADKDRIDAGIRKMVRMKNIDRNDPVMMLSSPN